MLNSVCSIVGILILSVAAHASTDQNFECEVCVPGTYCFNDVNFSCPLFSSSPVASDNISDCVCNVGYFKHGANPHTCVSCPENFYCPGDNLQYACPANSASQLNSAELNDCLCVAGYWRDATSATWCEACAPGKYKDTAGFQACTVCPVDTFNENSAGTNVAACSSCPANSSSSNLTQHAHNRDQYTDCRCAHGFATLDALDSLSCVACLPGKYDGRSDGSEQSVECIECPPNTYASGSAAYTCTPCVSNSATDGIGKSSLSECLCVAGHARVDETCVACDAGSFQPLALGGDTCELCPVNTFSAAGSSACTACHDSSVAAAGSKSVDDCLCVAGSEFFNISERISQVECYMCDPGYFKAAVGNQPCSGCPSGTYAPDSNSTACLLCPANTYVHNDDPENDGYTSCFACPANSLSDPGTVSVYDCSCVEGFFWTEASCSQYGNVKFIDGSCVPCVSCPLGYFKNSTHAASQSSSDDMCHACPVGQTTLSIGSTSEDSCYVCPANHYVHANRSCVPCPANAVSAAGSFLPSSCLCQYGFSSLDAVMTENSQCLACVAGKYKFEDGNQPCAACPAGKRSVSVAEKETMLPIIIGNMWVDSYGVTEAGSCVECEANTYGLNATCLPCPNFTVASSGSTSLEDCKCAPGYSAVPAGCHACAPGSFKLEFGNHVCEACPLHTYAQNSASTYCMSCTQHSKTLELGSAQQEACVCNAGFYGPDGGPCAACTPGTFSLGAQAECSTCGGTHYLPVTSHGTEDSCQACPTNSSVREPPGSGVASCVCQAGFFRASNTSCVPCAENHYCPLEHVTQPCPHRSHAPAGSDSLSDCVCDAGFYGLTSTDGCVSCSVNAYCEANVSRSTPCPANSSTNGWNQQVSISACVCLPGFYENDAHECLLCEPDSFCASDQRYECPPNSSALAGAKSSYECVCVAGMKLVEGEPHIIPDMTSVICVACDADEVCHGRLTDPIEVCVENASNVYQECQCRAGEYCASELLANSTASCSAFTRGLAECTVCPAGSYCMHNVRYLCPAFETSDEGSQSALSCRCLDGFYREAGVCRPCLLDHYCVAEQKYSTTFFDVNLRTRRVAYSQTEYTDLCPAGQCTSELSDAVCQIGMFRTSLLDLCKPCPLNFYCPPEEHMTLPNVIRCPENEFTLSTESSSLSQCICLAGFKLSVKSENEMQCLSCAPGELCSAGVVQEQCHANNKVPNEDHSACVCTIGHGWYSMQCQACPAGSVKPSIGDSECSYCGLDEYAVNATTCLPCPATSTARPGSTECACRPPLVWSEGNDCVVCPTDHYWTADGCVSCPLGSTSSPSPEDGTSELESIRVCRCQSGYDAMPQNVSGTWTCVPCGANTYESDGTCVPCADNAYSPEASASQDACTCNVSLCHTQHIDGSCAGVCAAPPPACIACEAGYYKEAFSTPGNEEECSICTKGTYQPVSAATSCALCPQHEYHVELGATDVSSCKCIAGFTRASANGSCVACARGSFKNYRGDDACTLCVQGTYNPYLNSTVCIFCSDATATVAAFHALAAAENADLTNSSHPVLESNDTLTAGTDSILGCWCPRGHEPVSISESGNEVCTPCVTGTFNEVQSHDACFLCGTNTTHYLLENTYGDPAVSGAVSPTHCLSCPLNSGQTVSVISSQNLMDEYDDCKCFPGYEQRTVDGCSPCNNRQPYMVQPEYSDASCVLCDAGYYFVQSNLPCQLCSLPVIEATNNERQEGFVVNSVNATLYAWGTQEGDCVCDLGYERLNSECHRCSVGFYRSDPTTRLCHVCAADSYQDTTGALECKQCFSHSSTLNATAAISSSACVCDVGFEVSVDSNLPHGRECVSCPAGKYRDSVQLASCVTCPEDNYCPEESVSPTPCPAYEFSDAGSSRQQDCECGAGRGRGNGANGANGANSACELCPPGSFAPGRHNAECTLCPSNKNTSGVGSTLLQDCKCVPGHGVQGADADGDTACLPCLNGFFASGGQNIGCVHCGWGTVTEPETKAFSPDCCLCDARIGVYSLN